MEIYPALKARMGTWDYYIVKMKMKELAAEVRFAMDVHEEHTLSDAIQRSLKRDRARKEIARYLALQPERFFGAIVVACLGGNPTFTEVRITDDPEFKFFKAGRLDESFGVLTFDGGQKYFALDGQHRLKAIKGLIDRSEGEIYEAPEGFEDEEVTVLMIMRLDPKDEHFLSSYRRLFATLNRYAKTVDKDTIIIMDEDDAFAIITRRLITEHPFFKWGGKQKESPRIKTEGKNITAGEAYFTSLQTLYEMNIDWLKSPHRNDFGWGTDEESVKKTVDFIRFRPDEEYLDMLYAELATCWDGLIKSFPDLQKKPEAMRIHDITEEERDTYSDHFFFWPICQEVLIKVIRRILNLKLPNPDKPTSDAITKILKPLSMIDWDLHKPPWRYFFLVEKVKGGWKMRDVDRAPVQQLSQRLIWWMFGIDELNEDEIQTLKLEWQMRLSPRQEDAYENEMWETVVEKRKEITSTLS